MTIKELIKKLLDCPMDAETRLFTSNTDNDNRRHVYALDDVDINPIHDRDGKLFINILFENWEFKEVQDD